MWLRRLSQTLVSVSTLVLSRYIVCSEIAYPCPGDNETLSNAPGHTLGRAQQSYCPCCRYTPTCCSPSPRTSKQPTEFAGVGSVPVVFGSLRESQCFNNRTVPCGATSSLVAIVPPTFSSKLSRSRPIFRSMVHQTSRPMTIWNQTTTCEACFTQTIPALETACRHWRGETFLLFPAKKDRLVVYLVLSDTAISYVSLCTRTSAPVSYGNQRRCWYLLHGGWLSCCLVHLSF